MASEPSPDILLGRRVRRVEVEVGPGLRVAVLEAADADVVLEEAIRSGGDAYAAVLWPSAIAAAVRLTALISRGMCVADVGAGTGVVALTAARLGARVIALDHDEFSRAVIARAAELEELDVEVRPWDASGSESLPTADLAVFADVLYEPELARVAARRTLEALAAGSRVLVTDPGRYARAEYQRVLAEAGVDVAFDDALVRVPGSARPSRVGVAVLEPAGAGPGDRTAVAP